MTDAPISRFGRQLAARGRELLLDWRERRRRGDAAKVEPTSLQKTVSRIFTMIAVTVAVFIVTLVLLSPLQHWTAQNALYQQVRLSLAQGAAPTGPVDASNKLLPLGTALGVFQAHVVGIDREVFIEGTSGAQTMNGIGHRRDTVMPCQVGTSVLMARSAAYGGVGAGFARMLKGDEFAITMGQGSCTYRVADVRRSGDPAPAPLAAGQGRLTLVTAAGSPYLPADVLRVDAELVGTPYPASSSRLPSGSLPDSEQAMGMDTGSVTTLVLLLEALLAVSLGMTWLWRRWGRREAWIAGAPVLAALAVITCAAANQWLLPNLL